MWMAGTKVLWGAWHKGFVGGLEQRFCAGPGTKVLWGPKECLEDEYSTMFKRRHSQIVVDDGIQTHVQEHTAYGN